MPHLLSATLLAASTSLVAQTPAPNTAAREQRVLAVLARIPGDASHLAATRMVTATHAYGCSLIRPEVGGLCGLGWRPAFDPTLARTLARELCVAYGLVPASDAAAPQQIAARLDAFDAAAGIGLKLRGVVRARTNAPAGEPPEVAEEPAATDLDLAEYRTLAAAHVRIHVADVGDFWQAASDDRLTTTLAYLASVVQFLNGVTDGEDVELGTMLAATRTWIPLPPPKATADVQVTTFAGGCTVEVAHATTVTLAIEPAKAIDPAKGSITAPGSNQRRPTLLNLGWLTSGTAAPRVVLRQKGADGVERELARGAGGVLFAPSAFAAERPFALVLALPAASYRLPDLLWIATAPR